MSSKSLTIANPKQFRTQLLQWAMQFEYAVCIDDRLTEKLLVGVDATSHHYGLDDLPYGQWYFGAITYDYKNEIEDLVSEQSETISFKPIHFFVPRTVIALENNCFSVMKSCKSVEDIYNTIVSYSAISPIPKKGFIKHKVSKNDYIKNVNKLQEHILRGDIFEINYCQEFFAEHTLLDSVKSYEELVNLSPMPFACLMRNATKYVLCASPERYIKKERNRLISQPIKGTAQRGKTPLEDAEIIVALEHNAKERSENIMAVDVVRNDFSKIGKKGSVKVDELCKVYTFKQLHQMISTVSTELPAESKLKDIIHATFPMASMTGAPKIRAMELIEEYENNKRGLYSGTVGYISPEGDFDFNVIIRTVLYDEVMQKVSFTVGSAITMEAKAEQEYEECMLKAKAIMKVLS